MTTVREQARAVSGVLKDRLIDHDPHAVWDFVDDGLANKDWLRPVFGDDLAIETDVALDDDSLRDLIVDFNLEDLLDYVSLDAFRTGYADGVKLTKYLKTMTAMRSDWSKEHRLAKLRDVIANVVNGRVVASIRPVDILTASEYAAFDSCHSLSGERSAGPVCYARDAYTAIVYAYRGMDGDMPYKVWRRMAYFIPTDHETWLGAVAFGNCYHRSMPPFDAAADRLLSAAMSAAMGESPEWLRNDGHVESLIWRGPNDGDVDLRRSYLLCAKGYDLSKARLSGPRCLQCGAVVSHERITEGCCHVGMECPCCEERVPEDEMATVEGGDEEVCEDCFERFYLDCCGCDEWFHEDDDWSHDSLGNRWCHLCFRECVIECDHCGGDYPDDMLTSTDDSVWLCEDCHVEQAVACFDCGNVFYEDYEIIGERPFCERCADKWRECAECGDVVISDALCDACCGMEAMV